MDALRDGADRKLCVRRLSAMLDASQTSLMGDHVLKLGTILGILLLAFTGLASANTVTMQLVRFDGPSAGGANVGGGVYAYPYYFSIDGSQYPNLTPLLCDTYDNEVWQNETWQANQVALSSLFGQANGSLYKEAAWLFSKMGTNPTSADAVAYNFAIWGLFSSNALNSGGYGSSGAAAALLNAGAPPSNFDYSGFSVYVPINGTQTLNGNRVGNIPQEYIGYVPPTQTPEPASLALLAAGLVAVVSKVRRNW